LHRYTLLLDNRIYRVNHAALMLCRHDSSRIVRPVHTRQQSCRKRQQSVAFSATKCCRFGQQYTYIAVFGKFVAWCGQALSKL